jgi:hypothetical protein
MFSLAVIAKYSETHLSHELHVPLPAHGRGFRGDLPSFTNAGAEGGAEKVMEWLT